MNQSVFGYLIYIGLCFLLLTTSCSQAERYDNNDYAAVDSILEQDTSIDSLNARLQFFSQSGNEVGVMLAEKRLGTQYRNAALFGEALSHHRYGLQCAEKLKDTIEIIQALNNIGTDFRRMGILDEASTYHYKALLLCEQYSDKKSKTALKNRVVSLNGIGNVHLTLDNRTTADSVFRLALAGEKALGSNLGQAINYANIGAIFEAGGNNDSALVYYNKSMDCNIAAMSRLGISLCHTYLGRIHEKEGRLQRALDEYREAYRLMENNSDRWHWLESCMALARIYSELGRYSEADLYLTKAESTALDIKSWEHLSLIHNQRYQWYKYQNDFRNALAAHENSRRFSDSVWNKENQSHLQNLRVNHEKDKSSIELAQIRNNLEEQRRNNIVALTVFSLVILLFASIAGILYYALRMKSHAQRIMRRLEKIRIGFFTNVTHEFRTPLTVIMGLARQLSDKDTDPGTRHKYIESIISQSNSLLQLVNRLLDVSKVQSAIGQPDWRTGNIVSYISMIVENYKYYARQKGIDLRFAPAETQVVMDFIPDYVHKVISNLLSNGLKFTDKGGKIYLTTLCDSDKLILRIVDNGQGIAKEDLPHIFEPFYQGSSNSRSVGTGIGLSLVHMMVKAMDGEITAKSAKGEGAYFCVKLPLKHGEGKWAAFIPENDTLNEELPMPATDSAPPQPEDESGEEKPLVLIVEDNTDVMFYIGELLKKKFRLCFAENGTEALLKANESVPDLIVSDMMMPEMDGNELCRKVRASEMLNHIPIVVITAKCEEEDRVKMLDAGVDAYLQKPFNANELLMRIDRLLEQRQLLREKYTRLIQSTGNEDDSSMSVADKNFLDRVTNIIFAKISDNSLNSTVIADKMCISKSQLNRKISAITGYSTLAYILQVRIEKAKRMLKTTDETISDIAMTCGFDDAGYFARVFKQQVNMTPSQFRKTPTMQ